jgi:uncharacterized membrane protein YdjX (TVP38/TMEM64 family)
MNEENDNGGSRAQLATSHWSRKRLIPLLVLLGGFGMFFALGLDRYVNFDTLHDNREVLRLWVQSHRGLASLAYMTIYATAIAFSLPGGAVLSITGGFLFGAAWGTVYVVISATLGAGVLFLIAKTSLGDPLRARAGPWLQKMQVGFQENALSYLLVLRLVPLFPFFVVNLVPAFLGVSLSTYVLGTFIGIIPGAFVYTSVGAGLGSLFARGGTISVKGVLTPQIMIALIGLAVLALIPVVYKKLKARPTPQSPEYHVTTSLPTGE